MAQNFVAGALAGLVVAGIGAGTVSVLMGPVLSPSPDVAVVPAAVIAPYELKLADHPIDTVGQQSGEVEVAEGVEEAELLFRQA